jgi:hypothetical protein
MNLYDATVPVFTKLLRQVGRWLDKAIASAEQRKFDPEILLAARLAPDQYPLLRQLQAACEQARLTTAKLAGKEPPAQLDAERTILDLRARLRGVIEYLATFRREDFEGAEDRPCSHSWMQGKVMRGGDYLHHMALPNLHFHLTTAYAILRHNGVPLGKMDYLGELPYIA